MDKFVFLILIILLVNCVESSCNSSIFFKDNFLIKYIYFKSSTFSPSKFINIRGKIDYSNATTIIRSFNSLLDIDISKFNIVNFENEQFKIYDDILKISNEANKKTPSSSFDLYYKNLSANISSNVLLNTYNNDDDISILDNYSNEYFKLIYFNKQKKDIIDEKFINNIIKSLLLNNNYDFIKEISEDKVVTITFLFRQIKTANKILTGEKLNEVDIYFTNIFCKSNISLLYHVNIFVKALGNISSHSSSWFAKCLRYLTISLFLNFTVC